jgi:hypothetical protein
MTKLLGLTLKRILKRHKKHPQDKELHKVVETGSVGKREFLGFITKTSLTKKN